jgi:hypothetical protein
VAVNSSANPAVFGQALTFTATLSAVAPGAGTPTGAVDFKEGATDLTPSRVGVIGGVATFSTSALKVGSHTITASYFGDGHFLTSMGDTSAVPQVVNQASSAVAVSSFPNASVFGQAVTFTATVSAVVPGAGTPTGTATFAEGTTLLASNVALVAGKATFSTAGLAVGSNTVTASYSGDTNFLTGTGSDGTAPQVVNKAADFTTVSVAPHPSYFSQVVTFTAKVQAIFPGAGTATGTVTFKDGTAVLGTGTLSAGQATFSTAALTGGGHAITASYGGDGSFLVSTSGVWGQGVYKGSSSTAVSAAPASSMFGQAITLTAVISAVAPVVGTPTGMVRFGDYGVAYLSNTVPVVAGQATFSTTALAVGSHTIAAFYFGDGNFVGSTGFGMAPQAVKQAASSIIVNSAANPSVFGHAVTFTAAVSAVAPGSGVPTGVVTFKDGTTALIALGLDSSGHATFSTSSLAVGSHSVTAVYGGSAGFLTSTSSVLVQTVTASASAVVAVVGNLGGPVARNGTPSSGLASFAVAAIRVSPAAAEIEEYSSLSPTVLDQFFTSLASGVGARRRRSRPFWLPNNCSTPASGVGQA